MDNDANQLNRLLTDLPGFSRSARPAIETLGQASVTGKVAVQAAQPTISHLNQFAKPAPELAQNLAIVGHNLDDRSRAVEPDPRSPHGQGYTGLEALLQYAFNQTLAINTFGPFGHQLAVDGFVNAMCTPYATPGTIATNLKTFGPAYRSCYSWLGPSQAGVSKTDPSNPSACVPDPGGAPPGQTRSPATVCKSNAADLARAVAAGGKQARSTIQAASGTHQPAAASSGVPTPAAGRTGAGGPTNAPGGGGATAPAPGPVGAGSGLQQTIGQILGALGGGVKSSSVASHGPASGGGSSAGAGGSGSQAQQLLNYLLAP